MSPVILSFLSVIHPPWVLLAIQEFLEALAYNSCAFSFLSQTIKIWLTIFIWQISKDTLSHGWILNMWIICIIPQLWIFISLRFLLTYQSHYFAGYSDKKRTLGKRTSSVNLLLANLTKNMQAFRPAWGSHIWGQTDCTDLITVQFTFLLQYRHQETC